MGSPPPLFGQCPKENVFFQLRSSLKHKSFFLPGRFLQQRSVLCNHKEEDGIPRCATSQRSSARSPGDYIVHLWRDVLVMNFLEIAERIYCVICLSLLTFFEFTERSRGSGSNCGLVFTSRRCGSKAESTMMSNPATDKKARHFRK